METQDLINQAAGLVNEASRLYGIGEVVEAIAPLRTLRDLLDIGLIVSGPCKTDETNTDENT